MLRPFSAHVYSDRLAKAVSSCNNYGEQRYDDLTAVIAVSTIRKTVRRRFFFEKAAHCFCRRVAKQSIFKN